MTAYQSGIFSGLLSSLLGLSSQKTVAEMHNSWIWKSPGLKNRIHLEYSFFGRKYFV